MKDPNANDKQYQVGVAESGWNVPVSSMNATNWESRGNRENAKTFKDVILGSKLAAPQLVYFELADENLSDEDLFGEEDEEGGSDEDTKQTSHEEDDDPLYPNVVCCHQNL